MAALHGVVLVPPENVTIVHSGTATAVSPISVTYAPGMTATAATAPGPQPRPGVPQPQPLLQLAPQALTPPTVVYHGRNVVLTSPQPVVVQPLQVGTELPTNHSAIHDWNEAKTGYVFLILGWLACLVSPVLPFMGLFVGLWLILPLMHLCRTPAEHASYQRTRTAVYWNAGSLLFLLAVCMMAVVTMVVYEGEYGGDGYHRHGEQEPYGPHWHRHHDGPHHGMHDNHNVTDLGAGPTDRGHGNTEADSEGRHSGVHSGPSQTSADVTAAALALPGTQQRLVHFRSEVQDN